MTAPHRDTLVYDMQDEQLEDLKQFIGATVSQTEERLSARIDRLETKVDRLEAKVDSGFAGVGEAIDDLHKEIEVRDRVIDQRLTNLEQAA
ncbi:MAG TPA: hypothetical protein VNA20_16195 [Frankiaceae bacterium]|nr:hypothetical protein [Frankiaceae bacterium]